MPGRAARRVLRSSARSAGQPGVSRQPDGYLIVAADLGAVDVDLDDRGVGAERAPGVSAVLVGAGTGEHDDIGAADELAQVVAG